MVNVNALMQVKAFARQEGVFLALLWLASFLLTMYIPASSWGPLMVLSTPFFVGWRLNSFRDYALDGAISFRRGYAFSWYTFLYASLLFAVAQYVFLKYIDHGAFMSLLENNIAMAEAAYKDSSNQGDSLAYMKEGLKIVGMTSPIQLAFVLMMQNVMLGTVVSIPIALFCKRKKA